MNNIHDFINRNVGKSFDPNNEQDVRKMKELLSGVDKNNADKIMQILSDKEKTEKLMQSEAAQRLMRILGSNKNG